jgi:hypothetical protein
MRFLTFIDIENDIAKIHHAMRKNSSCGNDLNPKLRVLRRDKSEKLEVLGLECPPPA